MSAAFAEAGYSRRDAQLFMALQRFFDDGGSKARAKELVEIAAERMPSEGRSTIAIDGQVVCADARQSNDSGEGRISVARNGQGPCALRGQSIPVPSVREPSAADVAAMRKVGAVSALSILDRVRTSDGRAWGSVGAHELDGMERDGAIAGLIKAKLGVLTNEQRFKQIRELMKPEEFEAITQRARELSHAA